MSHMDRRRFLQTAAALTVMSSLRAKAGTRLPIAMAVEYNMLPTNISILERFQLAKDCGFERIECPTTPDQGDAEKMKAASEKTALPIHSVMNMDHWKYPFSSADPAVVQRSLDGARVSIRNAHLWGASTVLLVPAVVNPQTTYKEAWVRSQTAIRKLIPLADELNVTLGLEEVWNKFLLSPLEFARYIDEYNSPRIRAYFDVGNVVLYGYPQDWIRVLGKRIVKLHIKDFSFRHQPGTDNSVAAWVSLGDGDIDWKAVYDALHDVGYEGTGTLELDPGDAAYLKEMRRRFGLILTGEMPKKPKQQDE
jgi:L-ribulose-5-phosphate 3-epimerase